MLQFQLEKLQNCFESPPRCASVSHCYSLTLIPRTVQFQKPVLCIVVFTFLRLFMDVDNVVVFDLDDAESTLQSLPYARSIRYLSQKAVFIAKNNAAQNKPHWSFDDSYEVILDLSEGHGAASPLADIRAQSSSSASLSSRSLSGFPNSTQSSSVSVSSRSLSGLPNAPMDLSSSSSTSLKRELSEESDQANKKSKAEQ